MRGCSVVSGPFVCFGLVGCAFPPRALYAAAGADAVVLIREPCLIYVVKNYAR